MHKRTNKKAKQNKTNKQRSWNIQRNAQHQSAHRPMTTYACMTVNLHFQQEHDHKCCKCKTLYFKIKSENNNSLPATFHISTSRSPENFKIKLTAPPSLPSTKSPPQSKNSKLIENYFILTWRNPAEMSRRSILFHNKRQNLLYQPYVNTTF